MESKYKVKVVSAPDHRFEKELNAAIISIGGKFVDIQYQIYGYCNDQIVAFITYLDHQGSEVLH